MNAEMVLKYLSNGDLDGLEKAAKAQLRVELVANKYGSTAAKRLKAAQAYLKRYYDKNRPSLTLVNHVDNYTTFTNGYTGFMMNDFPLDSYNPTGIEATPFNFAKYVDSMKNLCTTEVTLDVADLMANRKEWKMSKPRTEYHLYQLGSKHYNIEYLKEVVEIMGTSNLRFYEDPNKYITGTYVTSDNGIAVIMPVKLEKN